MPYNWLLLDADGTLFDYDKAESKALRTSLVRIGIRFRPEYHATYRTINAALWKAFERNEITQTEVRTKRFEQLFDEIGVQADATAFDSLYLEALSREADLIDGARSVLAQLAKHAKMVLLTNGIPHVQRSRLARSELAPYFQAIIISGEIGVAKPDPRIYEATFDAIRNPRKATVLMVGDSLTSDIQGGNNAGIDTCWYNPTRHPSPRDPTPTYEIASLDELVPLVASQ